jgi:glutamate-1-semialdehyde 2,1-aminomutase
MGIVERYVELHPKSHALAARALKVFPDGVTHDIRHASPFSLYASKATGSRKVDVDGHELIDYVMGHGALLLGHGNEQIRKAVSQQLERGTHYGASHEAEVRWGELVQQLVPSAERVRFTSSGTEATMMALRLARAFTGKEKVLRLNEHFHGWNDSVTGQPEREGTLPTSPGVPRGALDGSIVIPQGDIDMLERTLRDDESQLAAMILEPTGAHWGTDPISLNYVRTARELTSRYGIVLIFDEVITGFRVAPGGAQQAYGITPDMTTMAKIIAGGLPGGCVAGAADILDQIAMGPAGTRRDPVRQRIAHPGTFNANPLSAAAGSTCLELIADGSHQARASETAAELARALNKVLREESVSGCVYGYASMLHISLAPNAAPPDGYSWGDAGPPSPVVQTPGDCGRLLQLAMINEGVHLMGDGMMVSSAHTKADITATAAAFRASVRALRDEGVLGSLMSS